MVQISAITLPALLAALATLSVAAPTPYTSSDITAPVDVAAGDVAPADFASEGLEARSNRWDGCHRGYSGYWFCKNKKGNWYEDRSDYSQEYDQEYRMSHHDRYKSYHDRYGMRYDWINTYWKSSGHYDQEYDSKYWNGNYKRDVSEVEAPEFDDIVARDVEVEADAADFSIEARTDKHYYPTKSHANHYSFHGYQRYWKDGCWHDGKYDQKYDQARYKSQYHPYYECDGYLREYKNGQWCITTYEKLWDMEYYGDF